MAHVTVADLKARLSEYLRRVEAGESVVVLRHGVPVARLERITGPQLRVRPPRKEPGPWWTVKGPTLALDRDVVDYLAEERADGGEAARTQAAVEPAEASAPAVPGASVPRPRVTKRPSGRSGA